MQTVRLVLKLHRFDVVTLATALLVLAAATFFIAARLSALPGEHAACASPVVCTALEDEQNRMYSLAQLFTLLALVLPIFAGLMFGVPLVAREVERGTASLPWTMSRTRAGWFLRRVAILGLALVAVIALPTIALHLLTQSLYPGVDLTYSFVQFDWRWPLVGGRALAAFAVAVLAGALLGRALPGLLLAIAGTLALVVALQIVDDTWLRSEAGPVPEDPMSSETITSLITDYGYELPDGRVVDWQTAYDSIGDPSRFPDEFYPQRFIGIPGALAPEKLARKAGVILLTGIGTIGAALVVVQRRRPY